MKNTTWDNEAYEKGWEDAKSGYGYYPSASGFETSVDDYLKGYRDGAVWKRHLVQGWLFDVLS